MKEESVVRALSPKHITINLKLFFLMIGFSLHVCSSLRIYDS